jgi:hypothetical protein
MAGELKVGDSVLTKSGPKKLTYVDHVKKGHKIKLYMIEVEDTHLFYVGNDAVLTHNFMGLPVAVTLAVDVAFGTGTVAGAAAGSIFGPPAIVVGATIGFFVAMVTVAVHQHQLPKFSVDAYTPVSHTVLYESNPQPGYQSQFDTTPTPRVEPVGCFHPVPYEQPIGCGSPAPVKVDATQGCGNGDPVKPIIHITLPIPQSEKENVGCRTLPEEKKNRENTIICDDLARVEKIAKNLITMKAKDDTDSKSKEKAEAKTRYEGPTYERTEDWVKNHPFAQEIKDALQKSDYINQGKRVFEITKKLPGVTGFNKGDLVAVDAAHKDHLEVFGKNLEWTAAANFDGSKNDKKTQQVLNTGQPRRLGY